MIRFRDLLSRSFLGLCFALSLSPASGQFVNVPDKESKTYEGDVALGDYFAAETARIEETTFADIHSLADWEEKRKVYQSQLFEMLGLDPMPERTPLNAVVTGKTERDGVIVENVYFESMPGLFVTGNLYRPAKQDGPLPAILYVCGHGKVEIDGVSYGNKVYYQHHGAWFARNGYVCLTIDTIQLGEIEGTHHGTYREKMWWWNNRGYTPVGVEAWNGSRAVDYLISRPEVNGEKIGITGRSGGGSYSWFTAAIDPRIGVVVPVAGITNLHNHIVDGCVEGHCDCMYMVNTYRWDYAQLAAMIAPRPLLISNTDRDRIFPLEGVVDVYRKTREIYRLYGAETDLGLQITSGPHSDTQELRIHAFRWMNKYLRNDSELISMAATKLFEPAELKVFETLPAEERVTTIHNDFVPAVSVDSLPESVEVLREKAPTWLENLQSKVFRGWPALDGALETEVVNVANKDKRACAVVDFTSQDPYRLRMYVVGPATKGVEAPTKVKVVVLDSESWPAVAAGLAVVFPNQVPNVEPEQAAWEKIAQQETPVFYVLPRGVGPTEWNRDSKERTHIRRRFMLLGQTVAGMQVFDVCRALQVIEERMQHGKDLKIEIQAKGEAAVWTLYASLFSDLLGDLSLSDLPVNNADAPDLLNVSRFVQLPHVALMVADKLGDKNQLHLSGETNPQWHEVLQAQPWTLEKIKLKD